MSINQLPLKLSESNNEHIKMKFIIIIFSYNRSKFKHIKIHKVSLVEFRCTGKPKRQERKTMGIYIKDFYLWITFADKGLLGKIQYNVNLCNIIST